MVCKQQCKMSADNSQLLWFTKYILTALNLSNQQIKAHIDDALKKNTATILKQLQRELVIRRIAEPHEETRLYTRGFSARNENHFENFELPLNLSLYNVHSQHSQDGENSQHSQDENSQYSQDGENSQHSQDDNSQYSQDVYSQYSQDVHSQYSQDDDNSQYSQDDDNSQYSQDVHSQSAVRDLLQILHQIENLQHTGQWCEFTNREDLRISSHTESLTYKDLLEKSTSLAMKYYRLKDARAKEILKKANKEKALLKRKFIDINIPELYLDNKARLRKFAKKILSDDAFLNDVFISNGLPPTFHLYDTTSAHREKISIFDWLVSLKNKNYRPLFKCLCGLYYVGTKCNRYTDAFRCELPAVDILFLTPKKYCLLSDFLHAMARIRKS